MNKKVNAIIIFSSVLFLSGCSIIDSSSSINNSIISNVTSSDNSSSSSSSSSFFEENNSLSSEEIGSSSSSSNHIKDKINFNIYPFNDLHGAVTDTSNHIGIAKTSSYFDTKDKEHSIFISQGDMWQGSSESNNTKGKLVTEWMNDMGFVSMTLGNHEFDWSTSYIEENEKLANFPFLGINIYSNLTSSRVDYCKASTTFIRDGVKFGIIGAIGDCKSSISSSKIPNIDFKVNNELDNLIINEANRLRNKENVDYVILSIHEAYYQYDSSLQKYDLISSYSDEVAKNVDLFLEGHTHYSYSYVDRNEKLHVQTGANNANFYQISIEFDTKTRTFSSPQVKNNSSISISNSNSLEDKESIKYLFDKYKDMIGDVDKTLGYNSVYRNSEELKNLMASLYLEAGLNKWKNDYKISLAGGYLSCRSPYCLNVGNVNMRLIQELFPFENDIVLCSISGKNLKSRYINNSSYYVSYNIPKETLLNEVKDTSTYYVITDQYNLDYAYNNLTYVDVLDYGKYSFDLFADYVSKGNLSNENSNVEKNDGSILKPYTITEMIELCNEVGTNISSNKVYCKGFVTRVDKLGYSGGMSFYVGDENNTMYCYYINKSSSLNNDFNSIDDLKIGDEVIIYSSYLTYNSIPELKNGYLYSINSVLTSN